MNIPQNYAQWRHCITVICEQELTPPYIETRIESLNSPNDYTTKRFVELYGEPQLLKTIEWFEKARKDLK